MTFPAVGVVGASARAAVMSLARAGYSAWAVDLFTDRDLKRLAPVARCPFDSYPEAIPGLCEQFPPGPVLYTGGLENYPEVVRELARRRDLWGNGSDVLERVRDPHIFEQVLGPANLPCPRVLPCGETMPGLGRWLSKPRRGSGGIGVRFADDASLPDVESRYLQEFIDGQPMSAVFLSDRYDTTIIGVSEQLIGERWLHSSGFRYCGNIGPLPLPGQFAGNLWWLGHTLARETGLRGLWGLDFILRGDSPYPVEVNPRYTASVEIIELAFNLRMMLTHSRSFTGRGRDRLKTPQVRDDTPRIGKAIYFAPHDIIFPASGPWDADLVGQAGSLSYADIPEPGERIEAGWPVLTFFARGSTTDECRAKLREWAAELDILFSRKDSP